MTVKFSQLDTLAATSITDTTILPVVDTSGTYVNKKILAGSLKTFLSNVATTANLLVNSTLTPNVAGIYDLGTVTYKFGNLFLAGNTIQFGPSSTLTAGASGSVTLAGNLTVDNLLGTILTAAQPNVTSLGVQTQLSLSGNIVLGTSSRLVINSDPGTSGQYLRSGGGGTAPTWANIGSLVAGFAGNLIGGSAGSIPYQIGTNTTSFLGVGTAGYMLTSTGAAPTWTNPSSIIVNTANLASRLTGGTTGSIPYQTAANTTAMLSNPSSLSGTYGVISATNTPGMLAWRELADVYAINGNTSKSITTSLNGTRNIVEIGLVDAPNIGAYGLATTITMPHDGSANSAIATTAYVNGNIARNSQGAKIISSSAPSGGADGDIWYRV